MVSMLIILSNSENFINPLSKLFTTLVIHNFVPKDMVRGIIIPLIKEKFGDNTSTANYRPIMNSSTFLKLFEYCLLNKISPFVHLDNRQHGFRQ